MRGFVVKAQVVLLGTFTCGSRNSNISDFLFVSLVLEQRIRMNGCLGVFAWAWFGRFCGW